MLKCLPSLRNQFSKFNPLAASTEIILRTEEKKAFVSFESLELTEQQRDEAENTRPKHYNYRDSHGGFALSLSLCTFLTISRMKTRRDATSSSPSEVFWSFLGVLGTLLTLDVFLLLLLSPSSWVEAKKERKTFKALQRKREVFGRAFGLHAGDGVATCSRSSETFSYALNDLFSSRLLLSGSSQLRISTFFLPGDRLSIYRSFDDPMWCFFSVTL